MAMETTRFSTIGKSKTTAPPTDEATMKTTLNVKTSIPKAAATDITATKTTKTTTKTSKMRGNKEKNDFDIQYVKEKFTLFTRHRGCNKGEASTDVEAEIDAKNDANSDWKTELKINGKREQWLSATAPAFIVASVGMYDFYDRECRKSGK